MEFKLEDDVSDEEALQLIEAPVVNGEGSDGWKQGGGDTFQTLQFEETLSDPFTANLMNFEVFNTSIILL